MGMIDTNQRVQISVMQLRAAQLILDGASTCSACSPKFLEEAPAARLASAQYHLRCLKANLTYHILDDVAGISTLPRTLSDDYSIKSLPDGADYAFIPVASCAHML